MSLTQEDIQSLVWVSAALNDDADQDYDALVVQKMAAMSEVRHRMLDYQVEWEVMPKHVGDIDRTRNAEFLPETFNERAYALKSITHKKIPYTEDKDCAKLVKISASGHIIIQT